MQTTATKDRTGAPDPALSVRNLTIDLPVDMDRAHAIQDISFDLIPGQILCVIGESGSGKSITANAVMGLLSKALRISGGSIRVGELELTGTHPSALRDMRGRVVSMIFQDPLSALNPLMTVGDQIAEVMKAHGVGDRVSTFQGGNDAFTAAQDIECFDRVGVRHGLVFHPTGVF